MRYDPTRCNRRAILIEDKASGTQLIQKLRHDGVKQLRAVTPKGDKIMRMREHSLLIESGDVYLPAHAEWLDAYLHEMTTFPNGKYDDQVDSTSQALEWFGERRLGPNVWVTQI